MFLKRLEIYGFKSFADKLVLNFSPENEISKITGVVGPNGSGKSNVVDAIRWVLGEQSYKNLRSKKSEDVIFLGSQKKPKSSFASATLTLDNSGSEIPIDFNEVTVARKVYRSGETEYLINGSKVRLFDVQELLSKCGFGQTTYTVLGQGMVDQLLFYGPTERKVLFDEAAGVKQYQLKREHSLKKLSQTDQNIIRINDIFSEISPRLKHLKRQLERAHEKKDIEKKLIEQQSDFYAIKLQKLDQEIEGYKKEKENQEKEIQRLREKIKDYSTTTIKDSQKIDELRLEISKIESERDRLKEQSIIFRANLSVEESKKEVLSSSHLKDEKEEKELAEKDLRLKIEENEKEIVIKERDLKELEKELSVLEMNLLDLRADSGKEESLNFEKLKQDFSSLEKAFLNTLVEIRNIKKADTLPIALKKLNDIFSEIKKLWEKIAIKNGKNISDEVLKKIADFENNKSALLKKLNETSLAANLLKKENEGLLSQIVILEREIKILAERIFNFKAVGHDHEKIKELEKQLKENESLLSDKEKELEEKRSMLSRIYAEREKTEKAFLDARRENQRIEEEIAAANRELTEKSIDLARLETRLEDLYGEIEREGISLDVRSRTVKSSIDLFEAERSIQVLKRKVASIGEVDEDSEEELTELGSRHEFLEEQLTDLVKAKEDLEKVIFELDERIKVQFAQAFSNISEEFKRFFKILFDGGEAGLSLEKVYDEETEKESFGIEISVCPPGKKVKSLNALSGGERSLASLALLFAILSVNPSPFVVLDEVDAALDEANTKRFLKIIKDLSKKTQFIIITHNRDTMEAADSLYGVTMDDMHTSKLLSLKLSEAFSTAKND